ncbi:hypothetical protein GCM10011575_37880 [Microlunatus endophyticus]|uniref:POTRA domain-containing protein n=1 Tax=Microlunatus endophyticus TaxID=1716077 RepID=A0A917W6J8_9ACTN|nr:FtsQ-type POTRA domain-containing protein [Microlunatus endophyticus]GGL76084.1 hypothetical protein GCM10011575_37880 [Microlunatus endophyticus]
MTISPPDLRINPDTEETALLDFRRRRNRRRLVARILVPLLVLAVVAAGTYLVGFSSVLAVKSVRIAGEKELTSTEIAQVAAVPVGAPMARTDVAAIRQRVAGMKEVESASISRKWPNTVAITVKERTPLFAVADGTSVLLVDRFGVGFRTVSSAGKLPKAAVPADNRAVLVSVGIVVSALPASLQHKVERIRATTKDSITLELTDGDTVFWGSDEQSDLKAQVLVPLLKQKGTRYDVSAPGNPAIR